MVCVCCVCVKVKVKVVMFDQVTFLVVVVRDMIMHWSQGQPLL